MKIQNQVILVDAYDKETGTMEKLEAHQKAMLHRAVSVFIINSNSQMLLQQRAQDKYHSGGLWTNAACTHPMPGETNTDASKRRLKEEMGIEADINKLFHFTYREQLNNELTEYEFDHVYFGISDGIPNPDPAEVMNYKYIDLNTLKTDIKNNPTLYTVWFRKIAARVIEHIENTMVADKKRGNS